jgi:serine/threonine protein kinase
MKDLSHPNVVRYIGVQVEGSFLNVFMEYVAGGSIATVISRYGPLKEGVTRIYLKQILLGLFSPDPQTLLPSFTPHCAP